MDEKIMTATFDFAAKSLGSIGEKLKILPPRIKIRAHEIRLRVGRPVMLSLPDANVFLTLGGTPVYSANGGLLEASREDIDEAFRCICDYSVHSHQQEIKNGFITLRGGHRAGICGTAVTQENHVSNIRDISSINLRIAHEIKGAADDIVRSLFTGGRLKGTFIIGPPGCGKTTVLRDLARQLSAGCSVQNYRVSIVDERSEIAATYMGKPQNDLGPNCDVLDGYPKGEGMLQAIRSLSPDVIICDEIGGEEEARAVISSLNSGVAVIASAHAGSLDEFFSRPHLASLIASGAFSKIILLKGRENPGQIEAVFGEGELVGYKSSRIDPDIFCMRGGRVS